jgi:hypothetical protein
MPGPVFWPFPIIGLVTLVVAARFAFRPAERTLAILRPLSAATIAAALAAVLMGTANLLAGLKWAVDRAATAAAAGQTAAPVFSLSSTLGGVIESLGALAACAALMTVVWALVAVGMRRQH